MKPYGLSRMEAGDDDASGCSTHGRASGVYNLAGKSGDTRSYRSLRRGKKASVRRTFKRRERNAGKAAIAEQR